MKTFQTLSHLFLAMLVGAGLAGCATESHQAIKPETVASAGTPYNGPRSTLMVGNCDNHSSYMRGLFSDGVDRLGGQAKTILITEDVYKRQLHADAVGKVLRWIFRLRVDRKIGCHGNNRGNHNREK